MASRRRSSDAVYRRIADLHDFEDPSFDRAEARGRRTPGRHLRSTAVAVAGDVAVVSDVTAAGDVAVGTQADRRTAAALYLVFISVLTLPHVAVVTWMDWAENAGVSRLLGEQ